MTNRISFRVHSAVDLITNSSTTIYTDYLTGTKDAARLVLSAFLEQIGDCRSVDEVFLIDVVFDSWQYVDEYIDNREEYETDFIKNSVLKAEADEYVKNSFNGQPEWIRIVHEELISRGYYPENFIIVTKDEKYSHFVDMLKDFLFSPRQITVYT